MVENRELGRQRIREMIAVLRPKVSEFEWIEKAENDTYLLRMTESLRLRVDQSAVDQAADEPDSLPSLRMKIESELLESESGRRIGFVTEAV